MNRHTNLILIILRSTMSLNSCSTGCFTFRRNQRTQQWDHHG